MPSKRSKDKDQSGFDIGQVRSTKTEGVEGQSAIRSTRDEARERLLETIKRHRPDVLSSLAKDVFPLYGLLYGPGVKQLHLLRWRELRDENDRIGNRIQAATGSKTTSLFQLERALWRWADSFNVATEWMLDYALQTLAQWSQQGLSADLDWAYTSQAPIFVVVDVPTKFRFEFDPWDQESDTWRSYTIKLDDAFRKAKDEYRSKISLPDKAGEAREKREQSHFVWLIDFQIPFEGKVKSKLAIAREANPSGGVDFATVDEGISTLADLIRLKLRPSKRGRPRKP